MYIKCGNSNNRVDTVADYNGIAARFRISFLSAVLDQLPKLKAIGQIALNCQNHLDLRHCIDTYSVCEICRYKHI